MWGSRVRDELPVDGGGWVSARRVWGSRVRDSLPIVGARRSL